MAIEEIDCSDLVKENVKEISRKVLYEAKVKEVVIKNVWDNHGRKVSWENANGKKQETFKDVNVKLERVRSNWFGVEMDTDTLYLNGKKYEALDIYRCYGNNAKLNVTACVGQG